jgi:heme-degrading monooxygenase HmoA
MFVQMISMDVPLGRINKLREMLYENYIPALQERPGFISAHLLEQIDDDNRATLLIYWDNQRAVEADETGVLAGSPASIAAHIPGLHVRRQSYIVRGAIERVRV